MKKSVIKQIKNLADQNFNLTYKSISQLLLTKLSYLDDFNIGEYSKAANCSLAAFSKYAKLLGFTGTKTLIPAIIQEYKMTKNLSGLKKNQSTNEQPNDLIDSYHHYVLESINFSYENNKNSILEFNALLKPQHKIWIVGKGANLDVINILANYLGKINYNVIHSLDFEVQQKWIHNFKENDILILFSFSGSSRRIDTIFQSALQKKLHIINFTANPSTSIFQHSTINFLIKSNEDVFENQRTGRIVMLYLIMQILLIK